jgi:hypothetical protein
MALENINLLSQLSTRATANSPVIHWLTTHRHVLVRRLGNLLNACLRDA